MAFFFANLSTVEGQPKFVANTGENPNESEFEEEMSDFRYSAELFITKDESFFSTISGMFSDSEIEADIKSLRTFSEANKTVSNVKSLLDRLDNDVNEIYKKAHALGFYDASVEYKINVVDRNRIKVEIYINFGKEFDLKLNLRFVGNDNWLLDRYHEEFDKELDETKASIASLKRTIEDVVFSLQSDGYFDPRVMEQKVHIDYSKKTAVLNLTIDPGRNVKFYFVEIKAFPDINMEFIKNRMEWKEGERFNSEKMQSTAENLRNTQIFSRITIEPMKDRALEDKVPILISVEEDKKHMVDFSVLYSGIKNGSSWKKSQGQKRLKSIVARASWTNFNAFGGGEKLRITVEGTPMNMESKRSDYSFELAMTKPDAIFRNNKLESSISRRQELTNVFFKKCDKVSMMFSYPLSPVTAVNLGVELEKNYLDGSDVFFRESDDNRKYENADFPLELVFDNINDILNPTEGYRSFIKFYYSQLKHSPCKRILRLDSGFSYNYALDKSKKNIFSFYVFQKLIIGGKLDDLPLDKRLYAGGMNSIRGFANQMATEMVVGEDSPMGGKSLLEFCAEIRKKFNEEYGLVLFFDGAKIFQNKSKKTYLQTEPKRWFFSYGLGIRYFTSIGPIRIDFAFPIRRRKGVDSRMQFIISLGQAF
ncbi:MAG: BamA/TamA family outer membrane protein [Holosporaceae bacterium]|nr:BamA/TamA family outer membrane protein [Holosporaceae bacterium]